jgi:hypothetical protein
MARYDNPQATNLRTMLTPNTSSDHMTNLPRIRSTKSTSRRAGGE